MALTGRSVATASLLAVGAALFVPAFSDAAAGLSTGGWKYGPYLQTVVDQFPLVVGLLALIALGGVLLK